MEIAEERDNAAQRQLKILELLHCQAGLPQNFAERSAGNITRMHGDVRLSSVGMTEHFV